VNGDHGSPLNIPAEVTGRLTALGPAGVAWLEEAPRAVDHLARRWDLAVGAVLAGGSEALVLEARTADGRDAVLKIGVPGSSSGAGEAEVLLAAGGRGYVELIDRDEPRRAMLLERLGPALTDFGYPIDRQIEILCATLLQAWTPAAPPGSFMDGATKAASLASFIEDAWRTSDRPCSERAIGVALDFAERRRRAFSPAGAVLSHGDAHVANLLAVIGSAPQRFKFVDPDGLFIEPAYDLGVAMRGWSEALLAGDAVALGRRWAASMERLTGVDPQAVWEWAFIERISTGLHAAQVGQGPVSARMLAVADRWAL
jgi:streptomycin 6-kinase